MSRYSRTVSVTERNKDWNVRGFAGNCGVGGLLLAGLFAHALADDIYTCVDSKGRSLTADRPITECIDREQKQLNPSGTVRRKIGPSLTADERAAEEQKAAKALEERNRLAEEKRRERALLVRYPDQRAHDKERLAALTLADEAIAAARKNANELVAARRRLDIELEFYGKDPSKVPPKLQRQIDENEQHVAAQARFIDNQHSEKQRVNAQFDEELVKLRLLWAQRAQPATAAVPAAVKRPD